jgi:hypothetical protein
MTLPCAKWFDQPIFTLDEGFWAQNLIHDDNSISRIIISRSLPEGMDALANLYMGLSRCYKG